MRGIGELHRGRARWGAAIAGAGCLLIAGCSGGGPLAGTWDNGWTVWFLSWKKLLKGSALGEAVLADPDGSKFVSPSSLPPSTASAPLQTAARHSAWAA